MQLSVTFKNIDSSDTLKEYVQKKLDKLDKLFDRPAEARVVFYLEKDDHIAEVNLTSRKLNLKAKERSADMYSSIDLVIDKLKAQLNKFREKTQKHRIKSRNREEIFYTEAI